MRRAPPRCIRLLCAPSSASILRSPSTWASRRQRRGGPMAEQGDLFAPGVAEASAAAPPASKLAPPGDLLRRFADYGVDALDEHQTTACPRAWLFSVLRNQTIAWPFNARRLILRLLRAALDPLEFCDPLRLSDLCLRQRPSEVGCAQSRVHIPFKRREPRVVRADPK
jgi:hypothetical protein